MTPMRQSQRKLPGLSRLSIPFRLVLLSAALLAILVGTNIYLNRELKLPADALVAESRYAENVRMASEAEKAFSDMKYWLTDAAVSLVVPLATFDSAPKTASRLSVPRKDTSWNW